VEKMRANISGQIENLRALSRQQLLDIWQKLYRRAAPTGIRRELLVPFLAYRMQEIAYGGLKPATRSELRRIARGIENSSSSTDQIRHPRIKPGTHIIRQWRGETHEVVVTKLGYEYRRASYNSLSEIARKITGTRWSGPAFFGLKSLKLDSARHDD
jgi:hypothetical protein